MKTTSSLVLGTLPFASLSDFPKRVRAFVMRPRSKAACFLGACLLLMSNGCSPDGRDGVHGDPDANISHDPDASSLSSCHHAIETYYNPGHDGIGGTSDDFIDETEEIEFAQGPSDPLFKSHPIKILRKNGSGQPTMLVRMTYDTHGVRQTSTQFGPGPDGIYASPDDTIMGLNVYTSDTSGHLVNDIIYSSAGPNGSWGDVDDTAVGSLSFRYVGEQLEWFLHGIAPGGDGVWGTADDSFPSGSHLRYDMGRLSAMETTASKGPDGMFGTADDIISLRLVFPCQDDRVVTNAYYDPGPDGVWGSADDRLAGRQVESGDECQSACAPLLF